MIATLLTVAVTLVAITGLIILAFQAFSWREKAFKKVTIPAVTQPFPPLPQMVGLSKTIEEAVADEAAKKLAADIEYDLFVGKPPEPPAATTADGLNAMFGYYDDKKNSDDDWSSVKPEKPKRKRAPKKKPSRVGKARRRGPRAKR